jgi:outer membrane lipoprotein carrier protein
MSLVRTPALRTLICLGVVCLSTAAAHADAAADAKCLKDAIAAIQRRYEAVRDLRANFVQTTRGASVSGRAPAESRSRGKLVVAKPSRMRWSYEAPEPSLVVSDGKTLWIYDPAFKEAQRMPVGGGFLSGAALEFLLGRGEMERDFDVRLLSCAPDAVELELHPREPTSYEKLTLLADPRRGDVSRTRIDDLLGNVTIVEFSDLKVNVDPPADTFRFDPPEGTKVIELDAPAR